MIDIDENAPPIPGLKWRENDDIRQDDGRYFATVRDQWGREYHAVIDAKVKGPGKEPSPCWIGVLTPKFQAPVQVPQAYYKPVIGDPTRCLVDVDQWLADVLEANAADQRAMAAVAKARFGGAADAALARNEPAIRFEVGPPPLHEHIVRAFRASNSWVLGRSPVEPAWLTDAVKETLRVYETMHIGAVGHLADDIAQFGDDEAIAAGVAPSVAPEDALFADDQALAAAVAPRRSARQRARED